MSLEQVLALAASNPSFRRALLADRREAMRAWGIQLAGRDLDILDAIPEDQLRATLQELPPGAPPIEAPPPESFARIQGIRPGRHGQVKGIRPGRVIAATAATAALIGGGAALLSAGVRPDSEPPASSAPASQDPVTAGDVQDRESTDAGPDGGGDAAGP